MCLRCARSPLAQLSRGLHSRLLHLLPVVAFLGSIPFSVYVTRGRGKCYDFLPQTCGFVLEDKLSTQRNQYTASRTDYSDKTALVIC